MTIKPQVRLTNEYDKAFTVTMAGRKHTFDSLECAIHALAPICNHCGCKVIGHGVEDDGVFFCSVHCAEHEGVAGLKDWAGRQGNGPIL